MDKAEISSAACCPRICSGVDSTLSRESTYKDFCCLDGEACCWVVFSFFFFWTAAEHWRGTHTSLCLFCTFSKAPWCRFVSSLVRFHICPCCISRLHSGQQLSLNVLPCVLILKYIKKLSPESLIRPQPLSWSLTKWNMTKRRGRISRQTLFIIIYVGSLFVIA